MNDMIDMMCAALENKVHGLHICRGSKSKSRANALVGHFTAEKTPGASNDVLPVTPAGDAVLGEVSAGVRE